jgi:hypothetical protein
MSQFKIDPLIILDIYRDNIRYSKKNGFICFHTIWNDIDDQYPNWRYSESYDFVIFLVEICDHLLNPRLYPRIPSDRDNVEWQTAAGIIRDNWKSV